MKKTLIKWSCEKWKKNEKNEKKMKKTLIKWSCLHLRDGPLENLLGEGGGGEVQKKIRASEK